MTDKVMDKPEIATKAPESDAVEEPLIPGDTQAQSGASMGVSPFLNLNHDVRDG